jgi:hypothetical protein
MNRVYSNKDFKIMKKCAMEAGSWFECSDLCKKHGVIVPWSTLQAYASKRKWKREKISRGGYYKRRNHLGILVDV